MAAPPIAIKRNAVADAAPSRRPAAIRSAARNAPHIPTCSTADAVTTCFTVSARRGSPPYAAPMVGAKPWTGVQPGGTQRYRRLKATAHAPRQAPHAASAQRRPIGRGRAADGLIDG